MSCKSRCTWPAFWCDLAVRDGTEEGNDLDLDSGVSFAELQIYKYGHNQIWLDGSGVRHEGLYFYYEEFEEFWKMALQHTACDCVFSRPVFENAWEDLSFVIEDHYGCGVPFTLISEDVFTTWVLLTSCGIAIPP